MCAERMRAQRSGHGQHRRDAMADHRGAGGTSAILDLCAAGSRAARAAQIEERVRTISCTVILPRPCVMTQPPLLPAWGTKAPPFLTVYVEEQGPCARFRVRSHSLCSRYLLRLVRAGRRRMAARRRGAMLMLMLMLCASAGMGATRA